VSRRASPPVLYRGLGYATILTLKAWNCTWIP
jgi:hypothetical protein